MKIGVLLPSEQQINQAGVRIRYSRIEPALQRLGHKLELIPIQNVTSLSACVHDVYVISKCYDARAFVIARCLTQAGKAVGVDLFDDYFSQVEDSRFVRMRYWLRELSRCCTFMMCSTPRMRDLAREYAPNLPVHVMNDPAEAIDANAIAVAVENKFKIAQETGRINVAWFGMGDNPSFPVGLSDLAAFGSAVDRLRGQGYEVRLEVLTNRRAMTSDSLVALARLATSFTLEEWEEGRERELLARSLISFLPVNAQQFSRAKSLNRAVTALSAGVQVLAVGFPLYEPLAPFLYRDPRLFLRDLRHGRLALRRETANSLANSLKALADPSEEAEDLANFFSTERGKPSKREITAVIHGKETTGDIHKFTQRLAALSVASPFCQGRLDYDVRFEFAADGAGYEIFVDRKVADMIAPALRPHMAVHGNILTKQYQKLRSAIFPDMHFHGAALASLNTSCADTAAYPAVMDGIAQIMGRIFPGVVCFHAEQSTSIPWSISSKHHEACR